MTWNHRIMHHKLVGDEDAYTVHEVYYNGKGEVVSFTQEPCDIVESSLDGLKQTLQRCLDACDKPVLEWNMKLGKPDWDDVSS